MNVFSLNANASGRAFLLGSRDSGFSSVDSAGLAFFKRSKERLRLRLYLTLLVVDLVCIAMGFLAAGAFRLHVPFGDQMFRTLAVVLPTFLAIAINNGAYTLIALERPSRGAFKSVVALLYALGVAIGLLFSLKVSSDFSRIVFVAGTLLSTLTVVSGRIVVGERIGRKYNWTFANHLVLVDGVPFEPAPGQAVLAAERLGLDVRTDEGLLLHRLNQQLEYCDRVVVVCPPERRQAWIHALRSTAIDIEIAMPELTGLGATAISAHAGEATLLVSSSPLGMRDRIIKRSLDVGLAGLALIVLAPLMGLLALAIRLDSPGPVLFQQPRFGQNNRMFRLLKFRSMRAECTDSAGLRSTRPGDERLTGLGAFLRRTSLDELPQLLNVLGGSMSIVGPRPHAVGSTAGDVLFWHIDRRYFDRHAIKPGITGLAQIRGFRGATQQRDDLTKRLHSDLEYVMGWTLWRDLKIIVATFGVLVHDNAY